MVDSLTLPLTYKSAWPASQPDALPERAAISTHDATPRFDLLVGPATGFACAATTPRPLHLVLALDTSGSAYGAPLLQTFAVAWKALGLLIDRDYVTALSFNEQCERLLPWRCAPLGQPVHEVLPRQATAANGTQLSLGLRAGLQVFDEPERPRDPAAKCLVVVSDGATHGDLADCAALAVEACALDCQLNFILIGEPTASAAEELAALATKTGGWCLTSRAEPDLATRFEARRGQPPLVAALVFTLLKDFTVEAAWDARGSLSIQPLAANRARIEIGRAARLTPPEVLARIAVPAGRPPSIYRAGDVRLRVTGLDDGRDLESPPADIFLEIRNTAELPPADPRFAVSDCPAPGHTAGDLSGGSA